jgi:hypothetical protein
VNQVVDGNTLIERDRMPGWLGDKFSLIDKKDLAGAKAFVADDVEIRFAHYQLQGADQFIKFVGGFDVQFSKELNK